MDIYTMGFTQKNAEQFFGFLDVVQVPLTGTVNDPLQPENVFIDSSKPMRYIGKEKFENVLKIHSDEIRAYLLGHKYPYIIEAKVGQLGYSLTLVKVTELLIKQVKNPRANKFELLW